MVGYNKDKPSLRQWQYVVAGGASGGITRCICQPLDVIKIRFQLQVEPIAKGSKYSSILQASRLILKEESLLALWSGHIPAQCLSISYGLVQFWCYEFLTKKCLQNHPSVPNSYTPVINFACGSIAGSLATIVSFPFDTIRTRLIAEEKTNRVYRGIWHTFHHMYTTEGKLSLYKGLLPTVAQIAPHSGAQFMCYKILTEVLHKPTVGTDTNIPISVSLYAGSIAGLVAKLFIYPFDLAKKRMQIQGFQHNRKSFGKQFVCKNFINCIMSTVKYEGFTALYKGLFPSLVKAMVVSALHFALFEEICNAFRIYNN